MGYNLGERPLSLRGHLFDDTDREVAIVELELLARSPAGTPGAEALLIRFDLPGLAPGEYSLAVTSGELEDRKNGAARARITVSPAPSEGTSGGASGRRPG